MVSKFQWKPFWLATQRDPQNDWTATQNRANYDVFAQAPLQRYKTLKKGSKGVKSEEEKLMDEINHEKFFPDTAQRDTLSVIYFRCLCQENSIKVLTFLVVELSSLRTLGRLERFSHGKLYRSLRDRGT